MTSFVLKAARALLMLLAVAGILATALAALPGDAWWIRMLSYPRLQILLVMLLLMVLLALLPGRGWKSWSASAALALACIWQAVLLAPWFVPLVAAWPAPEAPSGSCPVGERLRVLSANVQMTNDRDHRLLRIVQEADPDIAWFQETNATWRQELAPLAARMPHSLVEARENYYGIYLASKLPLEEASIQNLTNSRNPSAFATVTLPSGRRVRIYAIHPRPPQFGQSTAERDGQLMAMALAARGDRMAHVVVGDLNAVPWETVLDRMRRIGDFRDPRIGRGPFITWNAKEWLLKWPLDHIMPGPGMVIGDLRVLPAFGSDHWPILADLCVLAGPIERGTVPEALLAEAREVVRRGQGKAVEPGSARPEGAESGPED
ncbi:endonuclease/exonuclease/phosphatase family protein [Roseomonas sp. SSH11]|uniref:Endonuclease/exonuclease/phosphatase family protein n=1 Tax=Pararoseomonas baculiformis TaxID=2820812 RepID=A0ABS4AAX1_9PROT|nr:endonuclease/exonuclease/phosphatase family protein [Pararoseomonas baculiformis]MBP0444150.1 endonuclease/exonuclease/phosphatase family protein [Pararoseomonas baculiformis]